VRNLEQDEAHAAFIVRAVNSHDDMLAALTELLDVLAIVDRGWNDGNLTVLQQSIDETVVDRARAAIAKATMTAPQDEPAPIPREKTS
jgi:hypothetical protein